MRRVIWKFTISLAGDTTVRTSPGASIVLCGLDPETGEPAIWIEHNPDAPSIDRQFSIYGTGHHIEGDGGYPFDIHVGSLIDGPLVWHIYERRRAS